MHALKSIYRIIFTEKAQRQKHWHNTGLNKDNEHKEVCLPSLQVVEEGWHHLRLAWHHNHLHTHTIHVRLMYIW